MNKLSLIALLGMAVACSGCQTLGLGQSKLSKSTSALTRKARKKVVRRTKKEVRKEVKREIRERKRRRRVARRSERKSRRNSMPAWQAKSQLKSIRKGLERYCPMGKKPRKVKRCRSEHTRAKKRMARIGEEHSSMEHYADIQKHIAHTEEKLPGWEGDIRKASAARGQRYKYNREFQRQFKPHQRVLGRLWSVKFPGKRFSQKMPKNMIKEIQASAKLKGFAEWCKGKPLDKLQNIYGRGKYLNPKDTCDIAQNWKKLYKKYLNDQVTEMEKRIVKYQKSRMDDLASKGYLREYYIKELKNPQLLVDKNQKRYQPVYKALGMKMPAKLFTSIPTASKNFKKILRKAGRKNRWPRKARYKNGSAGRAFKRIVRKNGFSYRKYGLTYAHWSIRKNRLGIPLRKIRSGMVMVKKRGDRFCRIYGMNATAQYKGGGRYATPVSYMNKRSERFIVTRCN